ncbi:hypothetical protein LZ32DRAFT_605362 [Colletotrichum eremochloae]|nr:hypothetical protein LZ32DRAFT_605362 [Colletotrichum eremochloae]
MQLLRLALAIALTVLTLGAEGSSQKKSHNPWTGHRAAMEWWIMWPKADDRGLKLETLPACIRDCITPRNSWVNIRGENVSVHNVNRRVFCDPRLGLVHRFFARRIGSCSIGSCRFEHSLWRLRRHWLLWLRMLCIPPGVKRPKNIWKLQPRYKTKAKPMIDPSANYTNVPTDNDTDKYVGREAYDDDGWDTYEDFDWNAYDYIDWYAYDDDGSSAYEVDDWGVDEDLDWDVYEDFVGEASITDEAATTTVTRPSKKEETHSQSMPANLTVGGRSRGE